MAGIRRKLLFQAPASGNRYQITFERDADGNTDALCAALQWPGGTRRLFVSPPEAPKVYAHAQWCASAVLCGAWYHGSDRYRKPQTLAELLP